jgi:hypothetical protein
MSIFISIASYEDPTLTKTIKSALATADKPDDIVFGLGIQHSEMPDLSEFNQSQIRYMYWRPEDRPGLIRVRYLLTTLWQDEDYFLMTDSHMTFKPGWDTYLVDKIQSLGNKVVLMPQTPMGETEKFVNDQHFKFISVKQCDVSLAENYGLWLAEYDVMPVPVDNNITVFEEVQETTSWRSGCIFTYGSFISDVGFDRYSHTAHEEGYMSFRSFMRGWKTYQLNVDYIEHTPEDYYAANWVGKMDQRVVTTSKYEENLMTVRDMSMAFIYNDYSKYSLPSEKSPKEYWDANGQGNYYDFIRSLADNDLFNNKW